jgi:hypothetical protein
MARTQFEAFLSLRKVTAKGLDQADKAERRCAIKCIHNAPVAFEDALTAEWGSKTTDEAYAVLKQPDVKVTNQSDKDIQLPKLKELDEFAKHAIADMA